MQFMSKKSYTYRINIPNLQNVKIEKYQPDHETPAETSGNIGIRNLPRIQELHEKAGNDDIESSEVEELGELLFQTLFDQGLQSDFFNFYDQVQREEALLRIELKTNQPELIDLPWEFICKPADASRKVRIATEPNITFTRWQPHERVPKPIQLKIGERLRIALVVSRPDDLGPVKFEKTLDALKQLALEKRIDLSELISPDHPVTRKSVDEILRDKKPHIFHFIGHGRLRHENDAQFGEIAFADLVTNSYPEWIKAEDFGELFARHQPGVVVLQACESGKVPSSEPFVGIASRVIQHNIPVVVAMQYDVSNATAGKFSLEFYQSLARFEPVDKAVQEGRRAVELSLRERTRDFATPVIFMRIRHGNLFLHQANDAISSLRKKASQHDQNTAYEEAVRTWESIRRLNPEYPRIDIEIEKLREKIVQRGIESFHNNLAEQLNHGEIIFFIGSESLLPSDELTQRLADRSEYGFSENIMKTLPMISQYYQMKWGRGQLLRTVRDLVGKECVYPHTHPVVDLLNSVQSPVLMISSSYDNGLETILRDRQKRFAVISHHVQSDGQLLLRKYSENSEIQESCTSDQLREMKLFEQGYSVIYKICGSLSLCNPGQTDPMMITENDFFSFLKKKIPDYLSGLFSQKSLLFMSYNLKAWHDRLIATVVLENRLTRLEPSYAVITDPELFEKAFWKHYGVDVREIEPDEFLSGLCESLRRRHA
ncbi:MAG: CHAT domain-containing protein [Desulfobacterales bacterium]|nr:CHAT domain-containing protein [Desulfobacterales bacterium]